MAFTVTPLLSNIDLAESATPWSTGSLDPDFFKQGNNSLGFYMTKNARGSNTVTPAASVAWSTYTYPHLYFWMNSSVAAKMEAKSTGATTASGVTVRVTLANAAYREWHVAGSDTWDGGWDRCFVIDMSHTGTQLYASSGTWTSASNIASITWYFDLSNSGNIRNVPANCWLDAIRVGEGLQIHNTLNTDPSFDLSDVAAVDENVSNQYGVLRRQGVGGNALGCQGRLEFGDNTSTNHLDFDSQGEILEFLERNGSGYGLVNDNLYSLDFVSNSTAADQDVNVGVKVGTGDTATGRNGSQILAGGSSVKYVVNFGDANTHNITLYGLTIRGATVTTTTDGVVFTSPVVTGEVAGSTFDGCSQVEPSDLTFRNCNFLNSVAATTEAAFGPWVGGTTDIKNSLFVNNPNAIVFEASPSGDATEFSGMTFSGNTYAVRNESNGNNFTVNLTNGTTTLITDTDNNDVGTAQLTFSSSVNYTLTNIVNPSEVTILDSDVALLDITGTEVAQLFGDDGGVREAIGQTFQVTTAGKADRVRLKLRKYNSPTDAVYVRLIEGGAPGEPGSIDLDGTDEYADTTVSQQIGGYADNDFEIIACVRATDFTPAASRTIVGHASTSAINFRLFISQTGVTPLTLTVDDIDFAATAALGFTDDTWGWVRAVCAHPSSNTEVTFYTSTDSSDTDPGSVSWSQLGTTVTNGTEYGLQTTENAPVELGRSQRTGQNYYWDGQICYVGMWVNGTAATGKQLFGADLRTGPPMGTAGLRDDNVAKWTWELQGTSPIYYAVYDSEPVDASDLTLGFVEHYLAFPALANLATSTTYGVEIRRTGAQSATNYYGAEFSTTSVHAGGARYLYSGTAWSSTTGDLILAIMEAASENELYHVESVTTGSTTYAHPGTVKNIEVLVMSTLYYQTVFSDSIGSEAKSLPVLQVPDSVYYNP